MENRSGYLLIPTTSTLEGWENYGLYEGDVFSINKKEYTYLGKADNGKVIIVDNHLTQRKLYNTKEIYEMLDKSDKIYRQFIPLSNFYSPELKPLLEQEGDIKIIVGEKTFNVHKNILALRSK